MGHQVSSTNRTGAVLTVDSNLHRVGDRFGFRQPDVDCLADDVGLVVAVGGHKPHHTGGQVGALIVAVPETRTKWLWNAEANSTRALTRCCSSPVCRFGISAAG